MTPFQVYLLLQMDRIVFTTVGLAISAAIVGLICAGFGAAESHEGASRFGKRSIIASFFLFSIFLLTPSTSTVAAMIVLPKVTSPEALDALGKEGKELYGLAKKALTDLAEDKHEKEAK